MRIQTILIIAVLTFFVGPLSAAHHRHGRDCGHRYDSHQGSWISVQVATPFGVGVIHSRHAASPYQRGYHDGFRYSKHDKRHWKRLRKQRERQNRHFRRHSHRHGPHCWR